MANEQNLKPVRTKKEARERGRAGGIKSGQVRAERKTFKEELLTLLREKDTQKNISVALVLKALDGDIKAFEVLRDTVGEKPTDKIDMSANVSYENAIKEVADDDEY
jgi:hypothetical protein